MRYKFVVLLFVVLVGVGVYHSGIPFDDSSKAFIGKVEKVQLKESLGTEKTYYLTVDSHDFEYDSTIPVNKGDEFTYYFFKGSYYPYDIGLMLSITKVVVIIMVCVIAILCWGYIDMKQEKEILLKAGS